MTKTPLKELLAAHHLVALDKLACLLARLPDDYKGFDMSGFARDLNEGSGLDPYEMTVHRCGTSACAVGHLPYLGYTNYATDWNKYGHEVTGLIDLHSSNERDAELGRLWRWCFSCSWGSSNYGALAFGTAQHAAKRVSFMLDHHDTYVGTLDCYRGGPTSAHMGVLAMEKVGEQALLGKRRKVKLELFNPDLIEAIKA